VRCCCFTWNVQDRSWRPSCSHWSKWARYCTATRFSLVKEATGKDLTTNCSHAIANKNRRSAILMLTTILWDVTYSEHGALNSSETRINFCQFTVSHILQNSTFKQAWNSIHFMTAIPLKLWPLSYSRHNLNLPNGSHGVPLNIIR
jgi:hypothetical protein